MKRAPKRGNAQNIWESLRKRRRPFFALAPMANVTDSAFRAMIAKYGKPDLIWTEFVSADGLASPGRKNLLTDLVFSPRERPVVAQLFTGHPEAMAKAAALVRKLGFDVLDINMGCPDRAVEKQGGGAALIRNPSVALQVLEAARQGFAGSVTVKTRIGYTKVDMGWIRFLLEQKLPALSVHLRTRKEMSDVPAHWELMPAIVRLRDEVSPETLIIGNGDVTSMEQGRQLAADSGCDGIMVGRGIFGKPWFFSAEPEVNRDKIISPRERLKILLEHTRLFERKFCGARRLKSFDVMKKHFKAYVSGWDGAKELRVKLMNTKNSKEVAKVIAEYLLA